MKFHVFDLVLQSSLAAGLTVGGCLGVESATDRRAGIMIKKAKMNLLANLVK